MADINPNLPDPTLVNRPRRKAWFSRIRRLLFLAVLIGMGVGLHVMLPPAPRWTIAAQNGHVTGDGKILTTYMSDFERIAKGPLQTWDTSTGRLLGSIPDDSPFFFGSKLPKNGSASISFPLRYFAVVLDDKRVAFGNIQTGREWTITLPTKKPDGFPLDERWLKEADWSELRDYIIFQEGERSTNNPVRYHVVEAGTGDLVATLTGFAFPGQSCYYFDHSNKQDDLICYFALAKDGPLLTVWSIKERRIVRTLPELKWTPTVAPSPSPYHYCLVSGGKEFLTSNRIGESQMFRWDFWNLQTGARRSLTCESEQFPEVAPNGLTYAVLTPNWAVPFLGASTVGLMASPLADGQFLAASALAGRAPNCIELWDAKNFQKRVTVPAPGIADFKFSPDSRFMVVAVDGDPAGISLWNVETGGRLWEEKVDGAESPQLSFSPDSQFVLCRKPDFELEIRESVSGKFHWNISLKEADASGRVDQSITAGEYVAYSNDRDLNLAPNALEEWLGAWYPFPKSPRDGIVMVGHIATRKEIFRLRTDANLQVHYLSPDGRTLITSCGGANWRRAADTNTVFQAWDLSPRPRWGWVLGAPAGLLAFVLLMNRLFAWRARKRTPVIAPQ